MMQQHLSLVRRVAVFLCVPVLLMSGASVDAQMLGQVTAIDLRAGMVQIEGHAYRAEPSVFQLRAGDAGGVTDIRPGDMVMFEVSGDRIVGLVRVDPGAVDLGPHPRR